VVQAADVAYQSGYVAVEGSPDLDVRITQHPRKVDIGELTDAAYAPGRRLLGAYGFVGPLPTVAATVNQRDAYALPAAIVQRATVTSVLSANGVCQSALDVTLLSKVAFVEVELPAGATLWSAFVDDRPARPQRTGERLLLDLQHRGIRGRVRLVYENTLPAWGFTGAAALSAPRLWLAAERTAAREPVPVVDLTWTVTLPDGFSVLDTGGNLQRLQHSPAPVAAVRAAEWIYDLCGGIALRRGILGCIVDTLGAVSLGSRRVASRKGGYEYAAGGRAKPLSDGDEGPEIALEEARQGPADWSEARRSPSAAPTPPKPESESALIGGVVVSGVANGTVAQLGGWQFGDRQDGKGMRSLAIGLQGTGPTVTFRGLGDTAHVALQVFRNRRREAMAAALALLVFLGGVLLTAKPARPRAVYLAVAIALSSLLPILPPLAGWVVVLNGAFYGACALIPFYLAAAIVGRIGARVKQSARNALLRQAAAGLLALALTGWAAPNRAWAAPSAGDARQPVAVPADAVIVPYLPGQTTAVEQVLIPYDDFVALQRQSLATNQVEPETDRAYAIAGAGFAGVLVDEGDLLLDGWLELDVFADEPVSVPLALSGGVLVAATLDGAPARLGSVTPHSPGKPAMPTELRQQRRQGAAHVTQPAADHAAPSLQIYVYGRGRHRIQLTIRAAIERRGGWRVVTARLPVGAANLLALTVPRVGTELRLDGVKDRAGFSTDEPDSLIETTLPADGSLRLQWRPRISEGEIDRALTVASQAVLDVQEDNLRLLWRLTISFRRGEYSQFGVELPAHYLVEQVTGNNVRGWQMAPAATNAPARLRVELLKPARDSETVTLHLWRPDWVVLTQDKTTELPAVRVPDAARETGLVTVRRSPLLSIRALGGQGIRRTDLQTDASLAPLGVSASESPLGVQLFQSYAFAAVPYTLTLAVSAPQPVIRARTQTILRVAERERRIECRLLLDISERPLHRLRIDVPAELEVARVTAPGRFEWTAVDGPATRRLLIYLAEGAQGELPVVVAGRYGAIGTVESVALPVMRVADAVEQDGLIAVQSDPGFDAKPLDLRGIEPVLLQRVQPWLSAGQLDVTRLALHNRQADYAGRVALVPVAPDVACDIITNVRVTDRAIEETVLLDFTVRESGIRQVSFRLPAYLAKAIISAPLLREKRITALPEAGQVRVVLTLQDRVMDQLRVLVRGDRVLTGGAYPVRLAQVDTGLARRRILAVESAGRDELETSGIVGLERLTRQQKDWALAALFLRGGQTEAYIAAPGADAPGLVLGMRQRDTVETAGAGIGLAQATTGLPCGQSHGTISGDSPASGSRVVDRAGGRRVGQACG